MISEELEKTLQRTQQYAKSFNHQYMTLEHLLLSMLEDNDVIKVLDACVIDIAKLKENVKKFIEFNLKDLITSSSSSRDQTNFRFSKSNSTSCNSCSVLRKRRS